MIPDGELLQMLFNYFMAIALPFVGIAFLIVAGAVILNTLNKYGSNK